MFELSPFSLPPEEFHIDNARWSVPRTCVSDSFLHYLPRHLSTVFQTLNDVEVQSGFSLYTSGPKPDSESEISVISAP